MTNYYPGQRWLNNAEYQLGLGTVISSDFRTVTLKFEATGDIRAYAKQSAQLTRICFSPGDEISHNTGILITVERTVENDNLITYFGVTEKGKNIHFSETDLNPFMQLSKPGERLMNNQIDSNSWFNLRINTLHQLSKLHHAKLYGLMGCRTSLISHQLYIAHKVANRYAPRVLLADEVGLGKTIEAGLIIHQQILTERIQRVLIIVPESLIHQWLVEMLRRFNLHFSLFDDNRFATEDSNLFIDEQLAICSLEFLTAQPRIQQLCLDAQWDCLVVDEAHHLQWNEQQVSPEYQLIETLAQSIDSVLLLTATPEQLGKTSHFARLRLLDPARFVSFEQFNEQQQNYRPIADIINELSTDKALSQANFEQLETMMSGTESFENYTQSNNQQEISNAKHNLIDALLDRHGTGRLLYRNSRQTIKGFPSRKQLTYPLPCPDDYQTLFQQNNDTPLLSIERSHQKQANNKHWTTIDPRVSWLCQQIKKLSPCKILIIVAKTDTVIELSNALRKQAGIHSAIFHQYLTLIDRDKAAAYFADTEEGCQVLIASEIGSEGRNFQFAHHLILFDLPLNPDLLEQRIGRLDRIGQQQTINIHIPYLENSPQSTLYHWYHEGLNAFEQTCPTGHDVYVEVENDLLSALSSGKKIAQLLEKTQQSRQTLNRELQQGRDRLLEMNSCRPVAAQKLMIQALKHNVQQTQLKGYMEQVYDNFDINHEAQQNDLVTLLHPGNHMQYPLPELTDEGMKITYDRQTALAQEDLKFITWEHPLVIQTIDTILTNESGNTALTVFKHPDISSGTLLLESHYILAPIADSCLQANRYLPPTIIRVMIDENGQTWSKNIPHDSINTGQAEINKDITNQIIETKKTVLKNMLERSNERAQNQTPKLIDLAIKNAKQVLNNEINRLTELRKVNPNVRQQEIEYFENQLSVLLKSVQSTKVRLDAVRVIIAV